MSELNRIREIVRAVSGIAVETLGRTALERSVYRRMAALSMDSPTSYALHLADCATEIQQLVESLVVPETWFFRDQHAFSFLVQHALAFRRTQRVLRILSLPCSSGEEPYSIAMSLLDAGMSPAFFRIDAVDISHREIGWAKQGIYGRNSFRGTDISFRERHFVPISEGYQLRSHVRSCVRFERGNMFAPEFSKGWAVYDIIFCRNLLIYFDPDTQVRAVQILSRLLTEEGLVFGGPSETSIFQAAEFESSRVPRAFAFRRFRQIAKPASRSREIPVRYPTATGSVGYSAPMEKRAAELSIPTEVPHGELALERAAQLADDGSLSEARTLCEQHLRQRGASAPAFYLLGLVHDAELDHEGARECYRKALYLNPDHYESLLQLSLLMEQEGNLATAAAFRVRAERVKMRECKLAHAGS
jgi:chemotaxis protein methyltransferase WspC